MTKQAMTLIMLSALFMYSGSQAKIDNPADSDAPFANIAIDKDDGICDGAPDAAPCMEQASGAAHNLFAKEEPVWLDEIEECFWDDSEYYAGEYDEQPYLLEDDGVLLADNTADAVGEDNGALKEVADTGVDSNGLQVKQAMAAIAAKPIPREVRKPRPHKPKVKSKPKSNVAKIKPKQRPGKKKQVASNAKKKASAVDKSRTVQRAVTYTVRGKSYTTVPDSTGFVQKGVASWYGKRFHGLKTASGEPYDMNAMTAAHKKLPLGTKIEVINNENGKKVVVTVNDRGPFHGNRVLDLSKAAAKELGVVEQGTADVTIRAL